ncbi:MAG: hypothetical protein ACKOPS_28280 [Cyanobium sp.]
MSPIQAVTESQFAERVVRMGVVSPPATAAAAMEGLLRQGICSDAARKWLHQRPEAVADRNQLLAAIYERLEECPSPATEWQAVREVLADDELLASLLGIGAVSVRRYAKGERRCSDAVAARLHWLALVIEQLEGSYNAYGIRRWFQRPRAVLDGRTPLDRLQGSWDPDDGAVQPILALARSASLGMVAS